MDSRLCLLPLLLISAIFVHTVEAAPSSKFDKNAQSLGKHLAAQPAARKANEADRDKLKKRMIPLLEAIEKSDRSGNTNAESLLSKAMYFRDDMGDYEKMVTTNALIAAWRDAKHYGLFNDHSVFSERITKGRLTGEPVTFELIIPAERYPKASNQLANLRIVPVKEKRKEGEDLSQRDLAYGRQLVKMMEEKENFSDMKKWENPEKTNDLGQTKDDSLAAWNREVDELGKEVLEKAPRIRINGKLASRPSKQNKQTWRVNTEIHNTSTYPTEIELTVYAIGQTHKKRSYYIMAKKVRTLNLRRNEIRPLDTFTKAQSSYKNRADDHDELSKAERKESIVRYRGFVVVAKHKDKVVGFHGSDSRLLSYANPETEDSPLGNFPTF